MNEFEAALLEAIRGMVQAEVRTAVAATAPRATDDYVSVQNAAKLADVADGTVRRWIREGKLVGYHAGRVTRVRRSDLEKLLRDGARDDDMTPEQLARRDFR